MALFRLHRLSNPLRMVLMGMSLLRHRYFPSSRLTGSYFSEILMSVSAIGVIGGRIFRGLVRWGLQRLPGICHVFSSSTVNTLLSRIPKPGYRNLHSASVL
jgi:hypothetical protein